jgi:NAD-reducing hydrogenase small subunit
MSLLDMDLRLLEVAAQVEVVYSPLVDAKVYPAAVDVALVEGAVSNVEDLARLRTIRAHSKVLVALGDCAVTANVPAMRNPFPVEAVLRRAFVENAQVSPQLPREVVPALLPQARPLHEFVTVDVFVPGCPPSAETIYVTLTELLAGRRPDLLELTRFGK